MKLKALIIPFCLIMGVSSVLAKGNDDPRPFEPVIKNDGIQPRTPIDLPLYSYSNQNLLIYFVIPEGYAIIEINDNNNIYSYVFYTNNPIIINSIMIDIGATITINTEFGNTYIATI